MKRPSKAIKGHQRPSKAIKGHYLYFIKVVNPHAIPQEEFEAMLERAAERGARHALADVGLDGPEAAHDIRELRGLLDAFNEAKKTAGLTIVKMLVTGLVMALLAGAFLKLKLFGGGQ